MGKYDGTRAPISKSTIGKVAEVLGIKEGLNANQKVSKIGLLSTKVVRQALKRAGIAGFALNEFIDFVASNKKGKATSSMDAAKGQAQDAINKLKKKTDKNKAKPKLVPKGLRESIAKDKKKVKPIEKKKPIIKKKKVVTPPKKKKNGVTFEFKVGGKKDGR